MKALLITLTSAALLVGCAQNHETSMGASGSGAAGVTKGGDSSGQLTDADAQFARTAMESGMAEVRMGHLIMENGQSSALRVFGQRIVKDHTMANGELIKLAASRGVPAPSEPDAKHREMLTELSQLKGAEFDKAATPQVVMDHTENIRFFENASRTVQNGELKAFVRKTLPTLREHLELAKGLEAGFTTSSESTTSTGPK